MGEIRINPKFNVHEKYKEVNIINSYRFGVGGGILTEASHILALENHYGNWTQAVIQLQRVSDDDLKYVFFDGDEITLNSLVGTSETTPSATTLGTWIGAGDAHCRTWYRMNSLNTTGGVQRQNVKSSQPQFITSGVIFTKNGKVAFDLGTTLWFGDQGEISELDSGNTFTALTVSSNEVSASGGAVFSTSLTANDRLILLNDSRASQKRVTVIVNTIPTNFFADLLAQQNSTDQKVLSTIITPTEITSFFNGVEQTNSSWSGSYTNDVLRIGNQIGNGLQLSGTVQFIAIYDTDRDSDISDIQTEINNYYSIY